MTICHTLPHPEAALCKQHLTSLHDSQKTLIYTHFTVKALRAQGGLQLHATERAESERGAGWMGSKTRADLSFAQK